MKLDEVTRVENGVIQTKRTYDAEPYTERARFMRDAGKAVQGESWFVGTVPGWLVAQWAKEDGVSFTDAEALSEVVDKRLKSGEFDKLRIHGGNY